jgi:hypothetical protein
VSRQIPAERLAAFDTLAEVARTERICIVVRNRAVRRQYLRAFVKRGVDLANVYFVTAADTDREAAP